MRKGALLGKSPSLSQEDQRPPAMASVGLRLWPVNSTIVSDRYAKNHSLHDQAFVGERNYLKPRNERIARTTTMAPMSQMMLFISTRS